MIYSLCGGTKNCAPPLADGGGGGRTRKHMDVFQFIGYLRQFSVDVALIGAAVWGIDLLLRRTLLKKAKGKLAAFLPFLLPARVSQARTAARPAAAQPAARKGTELQGLFQREQEKQNKKQDKKDNTTPSIAKKH